MPNTGPTTRPPPPAERLLAEFRPDPRAFLRQQAALALLAGVAASLMTQLLGMPSFWDAALPVAATLALAVRGVIGKAAAMAALWRLTDRRLAGPGGVALVLVDVAEVGTFLGTVVVRTAAGERHVLRHLPDSGAAAASIAAARDEAKRRPRGVTLPPPVPVAGDTR